MYGSVLLAQKVVRSIQRPSSNLGQLNRALHSAASTNIEWPANEPVLDYNLDKKSAHREQLLECLKADQSEVHDVPIVIDGKEYRTDQIKHQLIPFEHGSKLAQFYHATPELIRQAANVATFRRREWELVAAEEKGRIFERAAELVSGRYRAKLNSATMLGQAKTIKQAEIDSAAELADFFRFNSYYLKLLSQEQFQPRSSELEKNWTEFRGLEGFVAAIAPFNFTAIAGNLINAPVLMGNCVVLKPSDTAILSNYQIFQLLREAGLPDGVVNFVPSAGLDFGRMIAYDRRLAGVNFTGSLATFRWLWTEIGLNVKRYNAFPRLVGECGGKNFHLIHPSAHAESAIAQTIRSAFEYSGQKCSACSRLYVPASLWTGGLRDQMIETIKSEVRVGPATDLESTYTSAVIDASAFARIKSYLHYANASANSEVLCGGKADDERGYFVEPTLIKTVEPRDRLMQDEIFGPVLTAFVYQDNELAQTLELINESSFSLTGAVFARDEHFIEEARRKLRMAAGNFYINDKSTGAVVGQQPFGGARHSGTNDKAGGPFNLLRWTNQLTVKRAYKELSGV